MTKNIYDIIKLEYGYLLRLEYAPDKWLPIIYWNEEEARDVLQLIAFHLGYNCR